MDRSAAPGRYAPIIRRDMILHARRQVQTAETIPKLIMNRAFSPFRLLRLLLPEAKPQDWSLYFSPGPGGAEDPSRGQARSAQPPETYGCEQAPEGRQKTIGPQYLSPLPGLR